MESDFSLFPQEIIACDFADIFKDSNIFEEVEYESPSAFKDAGSLYPLDNEYSLNHFDFILSKSPVNHTEG